MHKILVIIPAYNEEESILNVCKSIHESSLSLDCIVINDASTDATKAVCEKNHLPYVDLIHNLGIGGAVQTGYRYALENNYDIAIQFDGDGQHNVDYIEKILKSIINKQADLVIGSRFVEDNNEGFKSTKARRFGIRIISTLIKFVTGKTISDPTSGFRACNKGVIKLFSETYPIEYPEPPSSVKLLRNGYVIKEVPVIMNERKLGVSSIKRWKSVYYMINVCLSILIESIKGKSKCHPTSE